MPATRCQLLTSTQPLVKDSDVDASTFHQKIASSGLYWKSVTESLFLQSTGSHPLAHRRIVFQNLEHLVPVSLSSDSELQRAVLTEPGSGQDTVAAMLFGDAVSPNRFASAKVAQKGLRILEDTCKVYNSSAPNGFLYRGRFVNQIGSKVVYSTGDYAANASPTGNIYLWEVYQWGIPSMSDGDEPMKAFDGKPVKREGRASTVLPTPPSTQPPLYVSGTLTLYHTPF